MQNMISEMTQIFFENLGLEELKEQLKSMLEYRGLIYKHHRTLVCSSIWLDPINIVLLVLFIFLLEKNLLEAG